MSVGKLIIFTLASLLIQLARASELPIVHSGCYEFEDPSNPTQLPYPNDCTKFYKCSGGFAFPMNCPRGLHWSTNTNRCEYPAAAGCDSSIVVQTPESSITARDNNGGIENANCPLGENPSNPTQLAYPGDCTRFYKCEAGLAYPLSCPTGLHWSTALNRCEWPNVAQCIWNSGSSPAPVTGAPVTSAPVTSAPVTSAPANQVTCPAGGIPTQLPYPGDCNSFYMCINGQPLHLACPNSLHWSEAYKSCVAPSVANCAWGGGATPAPAPATPAPATPAPATPAPVTQAPVDVSDLDSYCRSQANKAGYYAYPGDCKRFIQCSNGRGYIQQCPGTLLFNSKLSACSRYCV